MTLTSLYNNKSFRKASTLALTALGTTSVTASAFSAAHHGMTPNDFFNIVEGSACVAIGLYGYHRVRHQHDDTDTPTPPQ